VFWSTVVVVVAVSSSSSRAHQFALKNSLHIQQFIHGFGFRIPSKGKYCLSFKLQTTDDALYLLPKMFIKTHHPGPRFHLAVATSDHHSVNEVEITQENDLLCFIFDNYADRLTLRMTDLVISKM
jgi:hypothetical protein